MADKKGTGDMDNHGDYLEDMSHVESIHETVHAMNPGLSEIYKRFLPTDPEVEDEVEEPKSGKDPVEESKSGENPEEMDEIPKETEETEGGEETKVLEAIRSLGDGMEATYNFQNKMRSMLGQDWQPKALKILEEFGTDEDHTKFEDVAYQAIPNKDDK